MGNQKKQQGSRRWFLTSLSGTKAEKIKMLTPDGKLVEVDKSLVDNATSKTKAGNREIYEWMKNPSK